MIITDYGELLIMIEILWLLAFMWWIHFKIVDPYFRKRIGDKCNIKIYWHSKPLKKKIKGYINPSAGYYHWTYVVNSTPGK